MLRPLILALLSVAIVADPAPQRIFFSRVFPAPGELGLFIANADGTDEHPLLSPPDVDYDAAWSADGTWIAFTSERNGSADIYRVHPDGSGLERLTDSPAYDDQAAFSPDGRQIVFVTTRAGGTADLWTLDILTRRAKALTSGPGGDFRPAWSPHPKLRNSRSAATGSSGPAAGLVGPRRRRTARTDPRRSRRSHAGRKFDSVARRRDARYCAAGLGSPPTSRPASRAAFVCP